MNRQQPTDGHNPSNNLSCPQCHTQLPPEAIFCRSCGKPVKKVGDWEIRAEDREDDPQEADIDTIRMASISQKHLKRWQSSQSLKNTKSSEQPHLNGPLLQDVEAPISSLLQTEIPKTEPIDAGAQPKAPVPTELLQSLPTTPVPAILETWQQLPDTEVPASKPTRSNWLWPMIIMLSALAAGLVNFVLPDTAIRPLIVFWFLVVCPGMVLVRFLRLKEPVVEWTLAIALSFAIEAIVAAIQLYAGKWSPASTLSILIGLCLGGAIVQLGAMSFNRTYLSKLSHIVRSRKPRIRFAISLAWVERFWEAQWSPRRLPSLISRSVRSAIAGRTHVFNPESSVVQPDTLAVPSHQSHAPHARKRDALWFFVRKYTVEKPATVAAPKRWRTPRAWKTGIVLIFLALLIGLGVAAGFWSHVPSHSAISRPAVTAPTSRPTLAPTPVPTIYPVIAGTYNGTIEDLSSNVSTGFSLTGVRQSQGKISGYLVLGARFQGSGSFRGTIDTANHLQFTVTDAAGHATFFFEGAIQSETSLSGDYYQCSSNPTQNGQCSRAPGGYGIWSAVLVP